MSRLKLISAHDALLLLRVCFRAPKNHAGSSLFALFGPHTAPTVWSISSPRPISYINTDLTDIQWMKASLPVRAGGLWVRRVATLASSAFLASAASTRELQSQLLLNCYPASDPHVDSAIMPWTASHNIPLPGNTSAIKQHAWKVSILTNGWVIIIIIIII